MYRDPQFNPGDIFCNWRHCELNGQSDSTFWQSMMSPHSCKDTKSLKESHSDVMRCLDQLIYFPGLWVDFSFTFIRRILEIGCPKASKIRQVTCDFLLILNYRKLHTIWIAYMKYGRALFKPLLCLLMSNQLMQLKT